MKMKHTKTPWKLDEDCDGSIWAGNEYIMQAMFAGKDKQDQLNAEFVVKAVNCYKALRSYMACNSSENYERAARLLERHGDGIE